MQKKKNKQTCKSNYLQRWRWHWPRWRRRWNCGPGTGTRPRRCGSAPIACATPKWRHQRTKRYSLVTRSSFLIWSSFQDGSRAILNGPTDLFEVEWPVGQKSSAGIGQVDPHSILEPDYLELFADYSWRCSGSGWGSGCRKEAVVDDTVEQGTLTPSDDYITWFHREGQRRIRTRDLCNSIETSISIG